MPVAELDGIEIAYELVGEGQPWVLTPGGRFTKEDRGLMEMARTLADTGRRVLTWDRPNCGASSVVFRGRSESEVQAEALRSTRLGQHPGVVPQRWPVAHMLTVQAP